MPEEPIDRSAPVSTGASSRARLTTGVALRARDPTGGQPGQRRLDLLGALDTDGHLARHQHIPPWWRLKPLERALACLRCPAGA
jgi:hypothetical protein